jgi:hypothetical protein
MSEFDKTVMMMLEGLGNMGTGLLSNRGGQGTQVNTSNAAPSQNAGNAQGVNMKFSNGPTTNAGTGTSAATQPTQPMNNVAATAKYKQLMQDPQNMQKNLTSLSPEEFNGFLQFMQTQGQQQQNGVNQQVNA